MLAVEGRAVTVASASISESESKQIFSLDNLELANALNESYTPVVIIDDGKVFRIDGSSQNGDRYEYYANLTDGSTVTVQNNSPHEVIVLNNCPEIYPVDAWQENKTFKISASDIGKLKNMCLLMKQFIPILTPYYILSQKTPTYWVLQVLMVLTVLLLMATIQ